MSWPERTQAVGSFVREHTRLAVAAVLVFAVVGSLVFAPRSSATLAVFYPSTCQGGWENASNAASIPDLPDGSAADQYTSANSAVLNDTHSNITCADFSGDVPSGSTARTFTVKLHWSFDDGSVTHDGGASAAAAANASSTSTDTSAAAPTDTSSSTAPSTPSDASATSTPDSTDQTATTTASVATPPTDTSAATSTDVSSSVTASSTGASGGDASTLAAPSSPDASASSSPVADASAATTTSDSSDASSAPAAPVDASSAPADSSTADASSSASPSPSIAQTIASDAATVASSLGSLVLDSVGLGSTQPTESANDTLAVRYSTDGTDWTSLGSVNASDWQDATFQISDPSVQSWTDLSNLQVGLFSLQQSGSQPAVYLDGMEVDVDYDTAAPSIVPTVQVTDPSVGILTPSQTSFTLDEAPTFDVTDPNLSDSDLAQLVQDNKATVIQDTLGALNVASDTTPSDTSSDVLPSSEISPSTVVDDTASSTVTAATSTPDSTDQSSSTTDTSTSTDTADINTATSTDISTSDTATATSTDLSTATSTPSASDASDASGTVTIPASVPDDSTASTTAPDASAPADAAAATPAAQDTGLAGQVSTGTDSSVLVPSTPAPSSSDAGAAAPDASASDSAAATTASAPAPSTSDAGSVDASALGAFAAGADTSIPSGTQSSLTHSMTHADLWLRRMLSSSLTHSLLALVGDSSGSDASTPAIDAVVLDSNGNQTTIPTTVEVVTVNGQPETQVIVEKPPRMFKPGLYTLQVTLHTDTANIISEQNFSWGVLAINVDRSIYRPGDSAYIQMGVVDNEGNTVCDADLTLSVVDPLGNARSFQTSDGSIVSNPDCGPNNFIPDPDYYLHVPIGQTTGTYTMALSATTAEGTKEVYDSFQVQPSVQFDIVRTGPTRVYPADAYPVTLSITPTADWTGTVVERTPSSFDISPLSGVAAYDSSVVSGTDNVITWNLSLTAGQTTVIGYEFLPPPISPEFYLIGPLSFYNTGDDPATATPVFQEARSWQIADDAVCTATSSGSWTSTIWTSCEGSGGTSQPIAGDTVVIGSGVTVTLNTDTPALAGVTVSGTLDATALSCGSGTRSCNLQATNLSVSSTGTYLAGTGSSLTITGSLNVSSGGTFNAGSAAIGITNGAGVTCGSQTVLFCNNGTFTSGTSKVTFSQSGASVSRIVNGGSFTNAAGNAFYDVVITAAGGSTDTLTLGAPMETTSAGYIEFGAGGTGLISTGNYSVTAGSVGFNSNATVTLGTSVLTLDSSVTPANLCGGTSLFNNCNGTPVSFTSGASVNFISTLGGASLFYFYGVTSFSTSPTVTIDPVLTSSSAVAQTFTQTGSSVFSFGNTITVDPSESDGGAGTLTVSLNQALTAGALVVEATDTGGSTGQGILTTTSASSYAINTAGTIATGTGGTLVANASLITMSGTTGATCGSLSVLFCNNGTFSGGTSTVEFTPYVTGTVILDGGSFGTGNSFHNLDIYSGVTATYYLGADTVTDPTGLFTVFAAVNGPTVPTLDTSTANCGGGTRSCNITAGQIAVDGVNNYSSQLNLNSSSLTLDGTAPSTLTANTSQCSSAALFYSCGPAVINFGTSTVYFTPDASSILFDWLRTSFSPYNVVLDPVLTSGVGNITYTPVSANQITNANSYGGTLQNSFVIDPSESDGGDATLTFALNTVLGSGGSFSSTGASFSLVAEATNTNGSTAEGIFSPTSSNYAVTVPTIDVESAGTTTPFATTLTATATSTATSLSVASATGISVGQTLQVESETMAVTGVSGTTISVTRATNGTTAAVYPSGTPVTVVVGGVFDSYAATVTATTTEIANSTSGGFFEGGTSAPTITGTLSVGSGGYFANTTSAGGLTLSDAATSGITIFTNNGTLSSNNSKVTYTGAATSTAIMDAGTGFNGANCNTMNLNCFHNLTIDNTSFAAPLGTATALDATGKLTVGVGSVYGTFDTNSTGNYPFTAGFVTMLGNASDIFKAEASTVTLDGTNGILLTKPATAVLTAGTSTFVAAPASGAPALISAATSFYRLYISTTGATTVVDLYNTTAANATITNLFYVETGSTFNAEADALIGTGATFKMDSTAKFCSGGAVNGTDNTCTAGGTVPTTAPAFPTFATYTFDPNSTVQYSQNAAETISATPVYGNLIFAPVLTAARTYTMGASHFYINGNFTIDPTAATALALTVSVTAGASIAVTPVNTTTSAINKTLIEAAGSATSIFNLGLNVPLSTGSLDIESTGTLAVTGTNSASVITVSGNWTNNGTWTPLDSTVYLSNGITSLPTTTLSAGYTSGSGSLSVASATGIVAGEILQVGTEQLLVTAVSGTTITVTGGIDGTTDANKSSGTTVTIATGIVGGSGTNTFYNLTI